MRFSNSTFAEASSSGSLSCFVSGFVVTFKVLNCCDRVLVSSLTVDSWLVDTFKSSELVASLVTVVADCMAINQSKGMSCEILFSKVSQMKYDRLKS